MTSHKNFKKAAGLMLVAILASRLLGLVREMLIARQFGSNGPVSAYTAAFNLPDLLFFLLSSGALSSAFIPEFTKRFETGKQKEAWEIFSIIACFMGLVLTIAIAIFWIWAKPLVSILAVPGFVTQHPELVPLTMLLTRIILPCQLFFFIGGLMMATLQSRQEFRATAAAPVIYNLGIIFGAIVLAKWFHIAGLALGTLIGAFMGNVVYAAYWMRKLGYEFHPSLNLRHPGVIRVAQLALPVIFGLGLPQIDVIVNKWFASFVSASAPAALNYANRLMQVPLGIFAQAAGTAILPLLSAYAAKNAIDDMRSGVSYGLRAIMVESLPATAFMIVMADPLVRMLYMGGEFRPSSVGSVAILLIWYSVGVFAWAGQRIVAPGFFAMQDTITPVLIGTASTIVFIPMNLILMRAMGASGIALATTIGISLHFLGMTWFLRGRLHGLEGGAVIRTVGRTAIAAAVMAVVCFGIRVGMSRLVGSWQFQDGDFKNPSALASVVEKGESPLASYIYSNTSSETRKAIKDDRQAAAMEPRVCLALTNEMNRVLGDHSLYSRKRFSRIVVDNKTRKLATSSVSGNDLTHTNHLLIEASFPDVLVNREKNNSWLAKISGAPKNNHKVSSKSWEFSNDDIMDTRALAVEFVGDPASVDHKKVNRVAKYILSKTPAATKALLKDYVAKSASAADMPQLLMHDLNTVIAAKTLYSPERFTGITISDKIRGELTHNPRGKNLEQVNRRLLESAFPRYVVSRPITRVESRMGSTLTVMIALILGGAIYMVLLRLLKVGELDYLWDGLRRKLFKRQSANTEIETPVTPEPMD